MSQLPEWHSLITSAVDGELHPNDRKRLKLLLKSNPEARKTLRHYRFQAKTLGCLPPPPLPCDFAAEFKKENTLKGPLVIAVNSQNNSPKKFSGSSSFLAASWVAIALSALLLVGIGGALLLRGLNKKPTTQQASNSLANKLTAKDNNLNQLPSTVAEAFTPAKTKVFGFGPNSLNEDSEGNFAASEAIEKGGAIEKTLQDKTLVKIPAPEMRPNHDSGNKGEGEQLLTAPYANPGTLLESSLQLPVWISWGEKDISGKFQKAFDGKINRQPALNLELPCNDSIAVTTAMVEAGKALKMGILIDKLAQDRLIKKNIRSHIGICLESSTPMELEALFSATIKQLEKTSNKSALAALGKGVAVLPSNAEFASVFQCIFSNANPPKFPIKLSDLEKEPPLTGKSPLKNPAGQKLLMPTLNAKGEVDCLVLAQSPYYPEVRTPSSSLEVAFFRQKKSPEIPGRTRVIIFLRQLLI
jgi:hypothetical protein